MCQRLSQSGSVLFALPLSPTDGRLIRLLFTAVLALCTLCSSFCWAPSSSPNIAIISTTERSSDGFHSFARCANVCRNPVVCYLNFIAHRGIRRTAPWGCNPFEVALFVYGLAVFISTQINH